MQMISISTYQVLWNCKGFFGTIIAYFWLKEQINALEKVLAFLAFIGMILVVKPNWILHLFGNTQEDQEELPSIKALYK